MTAPAPANTPPQPQPQAPQLETFQEITDRLSDVETNPEQQVIQDAIENRYDRLDVDLDIYRNAEFDTRMDARIERAQALVDRDKDDASVDAAIKQRQQARVDALKQEKADFAGKPKEEQVLHMLDTRVAEARTNYAKQLAARQDSAFAIKNGRRGQLEDAKHAHDVATGLRAKVATETMTDEQAKREAQLEYMLGKKGDSFDNNKGEMFKLARLERDERKVRTGRYLRDESGNVVEKEYTGVKGALVKAKRKVQDTWAKWDAQSRDENLTKGQRFVAKAKKVGTAVVAGVAAGAAGGGLGLLAGGLVAAGVGAGMAAGAAKGTKAAGLVKLNQGAGALQADESARKLGEHFDTQREAYAEAIDKGGALDVMKAGRVDSQLQFAEHADDSHKKNFRGASIAGGITALAGVGAGELVHGMITGGGSTEADGNATKPNNTAGQNQGDTQSPNGGQPSTGNQPPKTGDVTPTEKPQVGTQHQGSASNAPTAEQATTPPENSRAGDLGNAANEDKSTTGDADKNKPGEKNADGTQKSGEQTPDAANAQPEAKTVTPEQMNGKWVSQVYANQLGNGGFQEMLQNAQAALEAGEIEVIDNDTDTPTTWDKKGSNYYFRLTEAGAEKLGGKAGSTQTLDVMKALTSHSDKIKVA